MFPRLEKLVDQLNDEQLGELQFLADFARLEFTRHAPTRAIMEEDLRRRTRPINIAVNPHAAAIAACEELLTLIEARRKKLRP